jgi:4-alpha-glucanotransferase
MADESKELKYEGLAALIITQHEAQEQRLNDFQKFMDRRFNTLDRHNEKQNGSISKALTDIAELQKESETRKLTCQKAVETLQRDVKYAKFVQWIDKRYKLALAMFVGLLLVTQAIVHAAAQHGWIAKIFQLIKGA